MVAVRSLGAGGGLVHRVEGGDAVGAVPGAAGDLEPLRAEVRGAVDADRAPAVARAAADQGTGREGDQRERIVVRGESTDRLGCAGPGKNAHEAKHVLVSVQSGLRGPMIVLGRTQRSDYRPCARRGWGLSGPASGDSSASRPRAGSSAWTVSRSMAVRSRCIHAWVPESGG